ncbi:MAG TPA: hypothetical protein VG756_27820 [Pseudonocardiaceae bacterium]|nr:hypothetical protein [Pseudonocardiaceae bacterium]
MDFTEVAGSWRPEPVEDEQVLDPAVGAAVAGLWNQPAPGEWLPPLWHWFHFLDWPAQSEIGGDGHPANGAYLPPLPDRTRMFAGGVWRQESPLRHGEPVQRRRNLVHATAKHGRSGELLFVRVRSELRQAGQRCQVEEQDIVYRSGPSTVDYRDVVPATELPQAKESETALPLHTNPPLLFRMSALTGNQHRIHYDHPYVVDVEHYAGLVVHGPLLVLHMAELLRRSPGPAPREIEFRLRAPAFVGEPLAAIGEPAAGQARALRVASTREPTHATATVRW